MSWEIVYTAQARQDLHDIYEYVALELLAPETATGQTHSFSWRNAHASSTLWRRTVA